MRQQLSLPLVALRFEFPPQTLGFGLRLGRVLLKIGNVVAEVVVRGFGPGVALERFEDDFHRLLLAVSDNGEGVIELLAGFLIQRGAQVPDRADLRIIDSHDAVAGFQPGLFRRASGPHFTHQDSLALLERTLEMLVAFITDPTMDVVPGHARKAGEGDQHPGD